MENNLLNKMMSDSEREYGRIVHYRADKGWGFIGHDDSRDDTWFHSSFVLGDELPSTGRRVSYVMREGTKGRKQAMDVRLLDD
jgi:cold shock CspA family protein